MRAVTFDVSIPRYLLAKSLGRYSSAATFGVLSGLRLQDVPEPVLPGPEWVRLETILAGICGSDLGNITYSSSPIMEPFGSFPAVLGHEVLARVAEVGPSVSRVEVGQRVVLEPTLSCTVRGYQDYRCPSCASGLHGTCEQAGEEGPLKVGDGPISPGMTIGYHRDLPGGWSEGLLAHESQLFIVPDEIDDRTAVLTEPLAVSVHAAVNAMPERGESVLVIGSGPIAMSTIWALRGLGFGGDLVVQAKRKPEVELALALGASQVIRPGDEARQALVDRGAMAYQPLAGPEVYSGGGFPVIYDCVGSRSSLDQAMRYASPRGRIIVLGCSAQIRKLDLTFLWARELDVRGFLCYGAESWDGNELHTFEITRELLLRRPLPVERFVTHVFPLEEYRDALKAAANRRRSGAMKVVLKP
ncbi:MAG: zinc-binding dehydrogenase [Gemmatimonadota bacterium]|jgi:threonine dehydrogenase-like Zn-dependent dehydrogenase